MFSEIIDGIVFIKSDEKSLKEYSYSPIEELRRITAPVLENVLSFIVVPLLENDNFFRKSFLPE